MTDDQPPHDPGDLAARLTGRAKVNERLDRIEKQTKSLRTDMTALVETVNKLVAANRTKNVRAWVWDELDAAAAEARWDELGDWVTHHLLARHKQHTRTLRACWRQHPDVVDELTALYVVWVDAYRNPHCSATAAAEYHRRWLPDAMAAIDKAFTADGCRAGANSEHKNDDDHRPGRQWDDTELAAFLAENLAGRPTPEDPASTPTNKE
jgi:hypothetical protein